MTVLGGGAFSHERGTPVEHTRLNRCAQQPPCAQPNCRAQKDYRFRRGRPLGLLVLECLLSCSELRLGGLPVPPHITICNAAYPHPITICAETAIKSVESAVKSAKAAIISAKTAIKMKLPALLSTNSRNTVLWFRFRVWVSCFMFHVSCFMFHVSGFRLEFLGFKFRISGFNFQGWSSRCGVRGQGTGFMARV